MLNKNQIEKLEKILAKFTTICIKEYLAKGMYDLRCKRNPKIKKDMGKISLNFKNHDRYCRAYNLLRKYTNELNCKRIVWLRERVILEQS